jgi:hypothetical protein
MIVTALLTALELDWLWGRIGASFVVAGVLINASEDFEESMDATADWQSGAMFRIC